ncbi:methyltransferase family protein [Hydrogenispora ethanolica]|uniref:Methyltransferase family protein n=1 Tax=Hydrogenispora ethanolica TaxID=1082276 RepID=A0A4R1RL52_HYDET|nr:class I SAM-dependent methyltransferase [Hydrogenispora ethanolica]TCL66590.1 methyltransferase family protein [Hydrogenispora ethanolica]
MGSKEYFDGVARKWDAMRQGFFSEAVREKAYQTAGIVPGKLAADLGAGTGFITAGLIDKGIAVIAMDQSEEMLAIIKERYGPSGLVDVQTGGAERLPIPDQTVDYTFANMYLHHVEDPPAAIGEMARILKPGGKLVITDLDEHDFTFLQTEQHDRWLGFKRDDLRQWFAGAGLKNVLVDCVGQNCCAASEGNCNEQASISIFVASGEK